MIYAIPCQQNALFNHFAKAPQLMIVDNVKSTSTLIDVPLSKENCGKKKTLFNILNHHHVDAVIVRSIGQNMLSALFNKNIAVYKAPRGSVLSSLNPNQLQPVTDLAFGKPSPNKAKKTCASKKECHTKNSLNNKLSPRTIVALKKVLKLNVISRETV